MTYCLGINVATGLVAIADTRLTSGTEVSMNKKVSVHQLEKHSLFIMTSGLRSVRDDLDYVGKQWSALLNNSVQKLPVEWMDPLFAKIEETT